MFLYISCFCNKLSCVFQSVPKVQDMCYVVSVVPADTCIYEGTDTNVTICTLHCLCLLFSTENFSACQETGKHTNGHITFWHCLPGKAEAAVPGLDMSDSTTAFPSQAGEHDLVCPGQGWSGPRESGSLTQGPGDRTVTR